jgi:hypothetical protein
VYDDEMVARIDESSRETGTGLMCVVGAAVVLRGEEAKARQELTRLRLPGQRFLHWRTESDERRLLLLEAVAELGFVAFVVASHPVERRGQERARSRNLKKLGHVLSREEQITSIVIESRSATLDRRDAVAFREAREHGTVSSTFRFEHARKGDDPLLWAADIVTSAQSLDLTTQGNRYWALLHGVVLSLHRLSP